MAISCWRMRRMPSRWTRKQRGVWRILLRAAPDRGASRASRAPSAARGAPPRCIAPRATAAEPRRWPPPTRDRRRRLNPPRRRPGPPPCAAPERPAPGWFAPTILAGQLADRTHRQAAIEQPSTCAIPVGATLRIVRGACVSAAGKRPARERSISWRSRAAEGMAEASYFRSIFVHSFARIRPLVKARL